MVRLPELPVNVTGCVPTTLVVRMVLQGRPRPAYVVVAQVARDPVIDVYDDGITSFASRSVTGTNPARPGSGRRTCLGYEVSLMCRTRPAVTIECRNASTSW